MKYKYVILEREQQRVIENENNQRLQQAQDVIDANLKNPIG